VRSGLERLARWCPTNGWPAATEAGCSSAGSGHFDVERLAVPRPRNHLTCSSVTRTRLPYCGRGRRLLPPVAWCARGSDGHRERFMITGICYGCVPLGAAWSVGVLPVGGSSRAGRTPPAPSRSGTLVVPRPRRWHHSANRKCLDVDAARDDQGFLRQRPHGLHDARGPASTCIRNVRRPRLTSKQTSANDWPLPTVGSQASSLHIGRSRTPARPRTRPRSAISRRTPRVGNSPIYVVLIVLALATFAALIAGKIAASSSIISPLLRRCWC
jgi:hypothetical protein